LSLRHAIDLNAFFHRRSLYDRLGGFDESLTCLQDLDLILRYTEDRAPLFVPALVGRYETGHFGITDREPVQPTVSRTAGKYGPDGNRPPRALYATSDHPQVSEGYVRFEIDEMVRRGADIAVWSQNTPPQSV